MSNIQCVDLKSDRKLGNYWERQFCIMASTYDRCFTPHQWDKTGAATAYGKRKHWKTYTLPDITIWTAPGEHHEIKHKNQTTHESYGLEVYRFEILSEFAIITDQSIYYTIHDHDLAGGKYIQTNNIAHWVTARIGEDIQEKNALRVWGYSWVNGEKKHVPIFYWNSFLFRSLRDIWGGDLGTAD